MHRIVPFYDLLLSDLTTCSSQKHLLKCKYILCKSKNYLFYKQHVITRNEYWQHGFNIILIPTNKKERITPSKTFSISIKENTCLQISSFDSSFHPLLYNDRSFNKSCNKIKLTIFCYGCNDWFSSMSWQGNEFKPE